MAVQFLSFALRFYSHLEGIPDAGLVPRCPDAGKDSPFAETGASALDFDSDFL